MCCLFQPSLEEAQLHSPDVEFFEAELVKGTQGLGITIAGYIGERTTGEFPFNIIVIWAQKLKGNEMYQKGQR